MARRPFGYILIFFGMPYSSPSPYERCPNSWTTTSSELRWCYWEVVSESASPHHHISLCFSTMICSYMHQLASHGGLEMECEVSVAVKVLEMRVKSRVLPYTLWWFDVPLSTDGAWQPHNIESRAQRFERSVSEESSIAMRQSINVGTSNPPHIAQCVCSAMDQQPVASLVRCDIMLPMCRMRMSQWYNDMRHAVSNSRRIVPVR